MLDAAEFVHPIVVLHVTPTAVIVVIHHHVHHFVRINVPIDVQRVSIHVGITVEHVLVNVMHPVVRHVILNVVKSAQIHVVSHVCHHVLKDVMDVLTCATHVQQNVLVYVRLDAK